MTIAADGVLVLVIEKKEGVSVSEIVKAIFRAFDVVMVLPASYACCNVTVSGLLLQEEIWFELLRQSPIEPVLLPRVDSCVRLLKMIWPEPLGARVKSSLVPVVISVATPE